MAQPYFIPPHHNHDEVYVKIGEGGVTDHGLLTGLEDNDHPQYLLTTAKAADSDKLDGLDSLDFAREIAYRVSAYRDNTAFSLTTSGTIYAIPLNQEVYDTHAFHDNTTNPTRLTCQKAGTYIVTGQLSFAANATGNRDTLLCMNGTTYIGQTRYLAMASGSTSVPVTAIVTLNVGDYIEVCGRQYSGGSLDLYYANSISNYLTMVRIAP